MAGYRINVLGASGCGASTLGTALANRLVIPYFDSDFYYHEPTDPPFQRPRTPQDRCAVISQDLNPTQSWVLGGGVAGWEPYPKLDFTLIVFLYTPTEVRMQRLRQREKERFGERILKGGDMYQTHTEFIQWASRYDMGDVEGKTLQRHREYLSDQQCPTIQLDGTAELESLCEQVLNFHSS